MRKQLITAALMTGVVLLATAADAKHGKMMRVEMMKMQEVTMADGTKTKVFFVTMNGGATVIAFPADKLPADLHKQLF